MNLKDSMGRFRTRSLFWETSSIHLREEYPPLYTLKENDHEGYPAARQIYLKTRDPTEYKAAMALVGSWKHWQYMLKHSGWFLPYVQAWRDELEIMLRSEAIDGIVADSASPSKSSVSSCKWLADKGWDKEDKRGRPSKSKIEKEAKILNRIEEELDSDITRMEAFH